MARIGRKPIGPDVAAKAAVLFEALAAIVARLAQRADLNLLPAIALTKPEDTAERAAVLAAESLTDYKTPKAFAE